MAPHNVYPCAGEGTWVTIAVADDAEWQRLCAALGQPDWACASTFSDYGRSSAHQDELDQALATWTRQRTPTEVVHHLQAHGVTSGPVLSAADAYKDPHPGARLFYESYTPDAGTHDYPGVLWQMSHTPTIRRPPCCLGEHNAYVYGELLGYSSGGGGTAQSRWAYRRHLCRSLTDPYSFRNAAVTALNSGALSAFTVCAALAMSTVRPLGSAWTIF